MPRKHEKMHRTQHYITTQQVDALEYLSGETGYGISEHLRRAIDNYMTLPHIVGHLRKRPKPAPSPQLELPLDNPNA